MQERLESYEDARRKLICEKKIKANNSSGMLDKKIKV